MGDKSGIEWTDATWNPSTGCDRISPGCDNCYALTLAKRLKAMHSPRYQADGDPRTSGPGFKLTVHPDALDQPLQWTKPRRIFVNSMSDLFHKDVPDQFIVEVFAVMAIAQQHTFQVLTKRPQRMSRMLSSPRFMDQVIEAAQRRHCTTLSWKYSGASDRPCQYWLANVWLGTSIESDRFAWRAVHLRSTPAAVRFISAEPLLGPTPSLDLTDIDWLIVGAESGSGARVMSEAWAMELADKCAAAGTALFVKQLSGGFKPVKDIADFPRALRVREFPS